MNFKLLLTFLIFLSIQTLNLLAQDKEEVDKKAQQHFEEAESLFKKGSVSEAVLEYRNAHLILPKNTEYYFKYLVAQNESNQLGDINAMKDLVLNYPDTAKYWLYLALFEHRRNGEKTEAYLDKAIKLTKDDGETIANGTFFYVTSILEKSPKQKQKLIKEAISKDKENVIFLEKAGEIFQETGQIKLACIFWQRALSLGSLRANNLIIEHCLGEKGVEISKDLFYVNDAANLLTKDQKELLELKIKNYEDSTSTQIAIFTVKSLRGKNIREFAGDLANKLGIGQKDKNNGILILVSLYDRQVSIEVGYGLESIIPDLAAKSIIDKQITPNFKNRLYYHGLDEALNQLIGLSSGKFKASVIIPYWTYYRIGVWVLGFFLIIYIFSKNRSWLSYIVTILITGGTGCLEYIFYINGWHPQLWWILLIFYCFLFLLTQSINNAISLLSRLQKECQAYLTKLQDSDFEERFIPKEVRSKLQTLQIDYETQKNSTKKLSDLSKQIQDVFFNPEKYFTQRADYLLIRQQKELKKLQEDNFFRPRHYVFLEDKMQTERSYFEDIINNQKNLDEKSQSRLDETVKIFDSFLSNEHFKKIYQRIKSILDKTTFWSMLLDNYFPKNKISKQKKDWERAFDIEAFLADEKSLEKLAKTLSDVEHRPENYFQKRNDIDLVKLSKEKKLLDILESKVYIENDRKIVEVKLENELNYFQKKSEETLSDLDAERLENSLNYFNNLSIHPEKHLKINTQFLEESIKCMNDLAYWNQFYDTYTGSSIAKIQNEVVDKYEKISLKNSESKDRKLRDLYTNYYKVLGDKPERLLDKISKNTYTASPTSESSDYSSSTTYSSSGSSSNNSSSISYSNSSKSSYSSYKPSSSYKSSYSSSSYKSSSSSWGGGSFGGGGASGSW